MTVTQDGHRTPQDYLEIARRTGRVIHCVDADGTETWLTDCCEVLADSWIRIVEWTPEDRTSSIRTEREAHNTVGRCIPDVELVDPKRTPFDGDYGD